MKYQEKIAEWYQLYLQHVRDVSLETHVKNEEKYKFEAVQNFQSKFDINATDLAGNIEESIINNNLAIGAMYFPRKMLIAYAQDFPEDTRNALKNLFDESKDVASRLNEAEQDFLAINEMRNSQLGHASHHTYMGLRFLSLLLGFRYPEKYNPLKPAEWKVFARFVNPDFSIPQRTPPGKQYEMYAEYIELLRDYIKSRKEADEIRKKMVEGLEFQDEEFRWMAQNIIFVTSHKVANTRAKEAQVDERQDIIADEDDREKTENINSEEYGTGFMPLEQHLEEYMVKNWDNIDFGLDLSIYIEDDGTPGQQYATDVGVIDILAKDKNGNFIVIELKRAEYGFKVVGQILNYIGWVKKNLASEGQKVYGLIIVGKANKTLLSAVEPVSDLVFVKEYRIKMHLENVSSDEENNSIQPRL